MRVCAGIVLYNPSIDRLEANILSILDQVNSIYLVDHGSKNVSEIEKFLKSFNSKKIVFEHNLENKGIAYALNQILFFANSNEYDWFLTLDQDSVCSPCLIEEYLKHVDHNVGQLTCNIVDRNVGKIDEVTKFDKFKVVKDSHE